MSNDRPKQVGIMKAKPLTQKLISSLGSICFEQPKLRGQHGRVQWIDNYPILLSSYGNPFHFLEHIQSDLFSLPHLNYVGELYIHGEEWTQQRLNGILNRTTNRHPDSAKIEFHVFDHVSEEEQWKRLNDLEHLRDIPINHINFVSTGMIPPSKWKSRCNHYLALGYEGIILRHPRGLYRPLGPSEPFQRPSTILKFKPRESDEYEIVGFREGTGWADGLLGSFLVKAPGEETPFFVGTGPELTKDKRKKWWDMREKLIGSILVVKHEPLSSATEKGIPICTSAYEVKLKA